MLPASGGNLSGGCNLAGSSTYDLISSGILLEHDFLKIHFIGWSPNQAQCPSYSLHDRLFKVNVHEIVHNLALLLDLELESRGGYYG